MVIEQVYRYFEEPPPVFLSQELAICYILSVLLQGDSFASELQERLSESSAFQLSQTTLQSALKILESENVITVYGEKAPGRGRPRRMFKLNSQWLQGIQTLWTSPIQHRHC